VQRIGLSDVLGLPVLGADEEEREYVEPRSGLEQRLCELYGELLGVARVGVDDDFFALGGDSLHVAQLLAQVDEELGRDAQTPACVLLRAPTVARLAALLEEEGRPSARVVRVGVPRAGTPLFFFPTHEWATVGLGPLAQRLDGEHAIHTFQPDLSELASREPSVAQLATALTADLRGVQPHGPYLLAGHCFGAALALEVARGLRAEGEEVGALVLLNPLGEHPRRARVAARWTLLHARRGTLHRGIGRRLRQRRQRAAAGEPASRPAFEQALARAGAAYAPAAYAGRLTVFAGADYLTPPRFWRRLAGDVSWVRVPGYTDALFRPPFVDALAVELGRVLCAADGRR
jgi:thioesterase domain-containing protein/acyl carrier protein